MSPSKKHLHCYNSVGYFTNHFNYHRLTTCQPINCGMPGLNREEKGYLWQTWRTNWEKQFQTAYEEVFKQDTSLNSGSHFLKNFPASSFFIFSALRMTIGSRLRSLLTTVRCFYLFQTSDFEIIISLKYQRSEKNLHLIIQVLSKIFL